MKFPLFFFLCVLSLPVNKKIVGVCSVSCLVLWFVGGGLWFSTMMGFHIKYENIKAILKIIIVDYIVQLSL